jgi:heat-inducible transcriptional repressor
MIQLTNRQIQILKAIIEEYTETAVAVGSEILDKKYNLGVSPATIRNEMVILTNQGFLKQLHTSAGRMPTPMALKFYVNQLMQEKEMSVADEVAVKGKMWDYKEEMGKLLHEATRVLSERSKALAIATTQDGDVYHAGYANILDNPEFFDIDVARTVLSMIDDFERMNKIFGRSFGAEPIHILLGDELGIQYLQPCGVIFTNFQTKKVSGSLGVIGSCRLNYPLVMPTLRYIKGLIEEIGRSW